jgi:hypothetical protein
MSYVIRLPSFLQFLSMERRKWKGNKGDEDFYTINGWNECIMEGERFPIPALLLLAVSPFYER